MINMTPVPTFLTNGISKRGEDGKVYVQYFPTSEIGEIRDVLVDEKNKLTVRQVFDKQGNKIFEANNKARIFEIPQIFGLNSDGTPKALDIKA